jgi:transcriptional regulator with GAF, ATPase, and Fis domain
MSTSAHGAFLLQATDSEPIFLLRLSVDEEDSVSTETVSVSNGILEEVLHEERLLSVNERDRPLPKFPWYDKQPKLHSLLAVPIKGQTGPRWALVLDHVEPDHFDEAKTELAVNLAEQMSEWLTSTCCRVSSDGSTRRARGSPKRGRSSKSSSKS